MSLSNNSLDELARLQNEYKADLALIQADSIKERHRAINAVIEADFIDYQSKMKFLELIQALNLLAQKRRRVSPIFEVELQSVIESGFELGNDLAQPVVENREEKLKSLVSTIQTVSEWAGAGFRTSSRNYLINVTQTMENTFSPPGFSDLQILHYAS